MKAAFVRYLYPFLFIYVYKIQMWVFFVFQYICKF